MSDQKATTPPDPGIIPADADVRRGNSRSEPTVTDYCASCAEGDPENECPKSEKDCGHHCNHVWSQNGCCWCGYEEGEE